MILTMGYCHFVNVKRIQDLATAGFFCYLEFICMTNSTDSKYPTRSDLAKANPYTERDKLSEEEREERRRKFNDSLFFGNGYFKL